ncbi:MAG: carboxylesterase/lipase family protein, partial [Terracidiphilus sp.]
GIPYAQPPVGDLRWRPPVAAQPWSGIREAMAFGAPCAQPLLYGNWNHYDVDRSSEDCLYLNVVTPAWPAAKRLPVMVWLHGGANQGGSSSNEFFTSSKLPEHGVVLVTLNYRLGVFGFLALPALTGESEHHASGNYGLMDQIMALNWVRANIAQFGGDPNNVTLFGQSAGSVDTTILMTSPLARGLFQKAIGESGAAFTRQVIPLAEAEQIGEEAFAAFKLPAGADGIRELRKIPAHELLTQLGPLATRYPRGFAPEIDGWVVPRNPAAVYAAGGEAPIPLLVGTTSREEIGIEEPASVLRAIITREAGDLAPQVLALYGLAGDAQSAPDPVYGSASVQWSADILFHCPVTTEALWHSAIGQPVYEYEFDHPIPGQEARGAIHAAELPYVFGYFPSAGMMGGHFTEVDFKLAGMMESYWTNFARSGDPNGPGLPQWPRLDAAQRYLDFTVDGGAQVSNKPQRAAQCGLYREWFEQGHSTKK